LVSVQRVGFRAGTNEQLAALHSVEAPIAAERGSNRMPQALDSYLAFARNLPVQFDDHAWLAQTRAGTPIAAGFCWSNSAGDRRAMECDVLVCRDRRRQGLGRRLLATICAQAAGESRTLLTWSTFGAVPAGDAFSRAVGASVARVNRTSELVLAEADWPMIGRWAAAARPRELGYRLEVVEGAFPGHLRQDAARFHHIMQTAPRDDLDAGDVTIDADFVAGLDRALAESRRARWTVLVRDRAGLTVGGTEVSFEPDSPRLAVQQNTGIEPAHRGLGLAKLVKAAMLERIRDARPLVQAVRTDNAFSNAPMLAINDALGFQVVSTRTDWQAAVDDLSKGTTMRPAR
jgi:GNAT superfamily N-acetyltransferase